MATPSAIYKDPNSPDLYYKQQGQEAFTKIGGPTELQNLAKGGAVEVGGQYQTYTPPTQPTTSTTPTPSLEVSPGVFNASSLKSFFDNPTTQYQKQLETMQPQFDQATQNLADINTQLSSTKAPSYSTLYNTEYQSKVAPLDAQAGEIKSKVDTIDQSLRTLEDAVRGEIGGQAPEAIIQAEIARRAKPLQLERQGYVDQYGTIAGQRDAALQGVTQALSFAGQEYSDQLGLLKERQNIAQSAVDQYSALIEKGQAASEREIDNFRQSFSLLLQQAPDVLQSLTEEEYGQLQTGFVPQSVMTKIGDTIAQQKLNAKSDYQSGIVGEYQFYTDSEKKAGREPLDFNAYQTLDANRKAAAQKLTNTGLDFKTQSQVDALAKEFDSNPIVKNFVEVQNKKLSVDQILNNGASGPADLSLVYEFMKALDPQSVVRETEFDSAAKSGNIFQGIYSKFNGYIKPEGGLLPQTVKDEFQKIINTKYGVISSQYNNLTNETSRKIDRKTGDGDGKEYLTNYDFSGSSVSPTSEDDPLGLGFKSPLSMGEKGLDGLKQSIIKQESGGRYDAIGLSTPHGNALGKYQIIPKFHFSKIGLKDDREGRKRFLSSADLQDKLFGKIIEELSNKYKGDLRKIAAAYYGGGGAAKIVGTKAADKKQTAGGIAAPSINEYVNSVLNRIG